MDTGTLSFGQQFIGYFEQTENEKVNRVKEICVELADIVNNCKPEDSQGIYLFNVVKMGALHEILNASMNTVKLITLRF